MGMETTAKTDQRKHVIQMSRFETQAVEAFIQSVRGWQGLNNPHITGRKEMWNVTDSEIMSAIRNGEIIEVHNNNAPEVRAVVRADIGNRAICVTVSLTKQSVVTVWVNTTADNHSGLRLSEYKWGANLMAVIASLRTPVLA
jgi:hypothetical protein